MKLIYVGVEGLNYRHGQSARGTSGGGGGHKKCFQLQIMERSFREIFLYVWRNWNIDIAIENIFPKAYLIMMQKWSKPQKTAPTGSAGFVENESPIAQSGISNQQVQENSDSGSETTLLQIYLMKNSTRRKERRRIILH
jgi:hypothetical protein